MFCTRSVFDVKIYLIIMIFYLTTTKATISIVVVFHKLVVNESLTTIGIICLISGCNNLTPISNIIFKKRVEKKNAFTFSRKKIFVWIIIQTYVIVILQWLFFIYTFLFLKSNSKHDVWAYLIKQTFSSLFSNKMKNKIACKTSY